LLGRQDAPPRGSGFEQAGVACRTLFETEQLRLGELVCPRHSRGWGHVNAIGRLPHVAFHRTSAVIDQAGRPPVVANPNHVIFYNAHQEYRRTLVDPRGYSCVFLAFTPELLSEVIASVGVEWARRDRFPIAEAPSDRSAYLLQYLLVERLRFPGPELLPTEELLYRLLATVVACGCGHNATGKRRGRLSTQRAHRELVEEAKYLLTRRMTERLSLEQLARELCTSPFHLARLFREQTGSTLHGYRNQLRVRSALARMSESRVSLTTLALELGYCSLSHFSDSFRAAFGLRPSNVLPMVAAIRPIEARRILEAAAAAPL
jgi:AraC family transcriptional regulator